jgi:adenylate kinase family enzyme
MRTPKLIILRGPSGSGKSTVANKLFEAAQRRTALIEQDHYRFIFKPAGGGSKPNSVTIHKMIKSDTLIALADGYDVLLEGILSVKSYSEVLDEIFAEHQDENYMYYFDISFEETLRRHNIRKTDEHRFGEEDMREWYPTAHRSDHRLERIIPEAFTIEETIDFIRQTSGFGEA